MNELLQDPAIRSGILPLVIAVVSGVLLRPLGWYAVGFGFVAALVVEVGLLVGFDIVPPKSNTHKVVLLGFVAAGLGFLRDAMPGRSTLWMWLATVAGVIGVIWVIYPVVIRADSVGRAALVGGAAVFVGGILLAVERIRQIAIIPAVTLTWLGLGAGGAALLGATALYGELGIAVGSAAGGMALVAMFGRIPNLGAMVLYPGLWFCAAVGIAAAVYSNLPWYSLAPLALIPWVGTLPVPVEWSPRHKAVLLSLPMIVLAALAVFVTWYSAGQGEGSVY